MKKKALSPEEVAELLGVSRTTIYREMSRGRLSSMKVGARRLIMLPDLEAYLGKERARVLVSDDALD
ncbi:MAG: helix-turn-helix domain-containing protein [Firmicutes bacterium]|nr:helix-turn-helix domain-containing protein [Bacillota bacterium]